MHVIPYSKIQSVPENKHIQYACLKPQILGLLLTCIRDLRSNWYMYLNRVKCLIPKIQSVPENKHIQYACLRPQLLGLLLILRSNWCLICITMPYSKISILRPQLQNGYAYFRGRSVVATKGIQLINLATFMSTSPHMCPPSCLGVQTVIRISHQVLPPTGSS